MADAFPQPRMTTRARALRNSKTASSRSTGAEDTRSLCNFDDRSTTVDDFGEESCGFLSEFSQGDNQSAQTVAESLRRIQRASKRIKKNDMSGTIKTSFLKQQKRNTLFSRKSADAVLCSRITKSDLQIAQNSKTRYAKDFNIMRYQTQNKSKTFRVYCFKEDELNVREEFRTMTVAHTEDDDKQSDKEDVANAINYVYEQLLDAVKKNTEQETANFKQTTCISEN